MKKALFILLLGAILYSPVAGSDDQLRLKDICRLKGQEGNTLQGLGLVVGLKGTGDDASKPTTRSLARVMQLMGSQIATDTKGVLQLSEIEKSNNVALVFVSATIPNEGAQQGAQLDCTISAISAKSLEGGTLMLTPLLGPRADRPTVYALAQGKLTIPDARTPTSASIHRGCKMETDIVNKFVSDDKITLILESDVGDFNTAQYVEDIINALNNTGLTGNGNIPPSQAVQTSNFQLLARARDPVHIEVTVPPYYRDRPVGFVSLLLELPMPNILPKKRVVINEREGVIIIGEDVVISPVAISHKNLTVDARQGQAGFVPVDPANPTPRPKLKNLVDALKNLRVPGEDVISIIKALKREGALYGEVIVQ